MVPQKDKSKHVRFVPELYLNIPSKYMINWFIKISLYLFLFGAFFNLKKKRMSILQELI